MLLSGNLWVYPLVIALPLLAFTVGLILFLRRRSGNRRQVAFDYETTAPKLAIESDDEPADRDDDESATDEPAPSNGRRQPPTPNDEEVGGGLWDRLAEQVYPFRDRREDR